MEQLKLIDIIKRLQGQTILHISDYMEEGADCGLTIHLNSGDKLSFGYSSCEGKTCFNSKDINELL